MKSRKLLIGASSPIAYSYVTESSVGRPTPVIESPVACCLLYDEVWFLTKNLCPPEMETLDFVHFVDREHSLNLPFSEIPEEENRRFEHWNWDLWKATVNRVTGDGPKFRCDNHARPTDVFGVRVLPTPGSQANLFLDRLVAGELDMELAENSPNAAASQAIESRILQTEVTQRLIGPRLSSRRAPFGFWHPVLNELRSDSSLKSFRRKIAALEVTSRESIDRKVEELNAEYQKQMRSALKDRLSARDFLTSTALFIVGLIPVVGQIVGVGDYARGIISRIQDRKHNDWTRFLCSSDELTEPGAAPNGGPATQLAKSEVTEGPPSVS